MGFVRRVLPVLLVLCLVCFASCAGEPPPPVSPLFGHTGNYEAAVAARRAEFQAEAAIERRSPDEMRLCFSAPEYLGGMAFTYGPDAVTVSYGKLSFPLDAQSVPEAAVAEIIRSALDQAIRQNATVTESTEVGTVLTGHIGAGRFLLTLEPGSGLPRKLFLPGEELEIEFTDFTFLD